MSFDLNSILYLVLGTLLLPLLKRFLPNLKLPNVPSVPALDISAIVNAIVAALLERLVPQVQEIVRAEVAKRPPSIDTEDEAVKQLIIEARKLAVKE